MKEEKSIRYEYYQQTDALSPDQRELLGRAADLAHQAYARYSGFRVGAALRFEDGSMLEASNQENAAYPSGLCAERVLLFYAGSRYPEKKISEMLLFSPDEPSGNAVFPCGACRQVMCETEQRQHQEIRLTLTSDRGESYHFKSFSDLLPFSFGPDNLPVK